MKSILQKEKICWFCGNPNVEDHHVFFGTANRKISEKYGYKVWLCNLHHTGSLTGIRSYAVHFNINKDLELKQYAQKQYEKNHTREEFIELFGQNYL